MTDPTPIRDVRTCREKQDAAIAELQRQVLALALIAEEVTARVAALEAAPAQPHKMSAPKPCFGCALAEDVAKGYKCRAGCAAWEIWADAQPRRRIARKASTITYTLSTAHDDALDDDPNVRELPY